MDNHELQTLLRTEGERLTPGPMPDLIGKGRAERRRRIGGMSAAAAILIGVTSVVSAQALSNYGDASVSVADSVTTSDDTSAPIQEDGCASGVTSSTDIDTGFLKAHGFKSLAALGMSLDDWPSGIRSVSTVEVLEETQKSARLLLQYGDNSEDKAVVHAIMTDTGWTTNLIDFCQ